MHARTALAALLFASILSAVSRPSLAQDPPPQATYTAAWQGIWQVEEETRDCAGGPLVSTTAYLDTVCAGEGYTLLGNYGRGLSCSGPGFTDTAFDLSCSGGSTCGCFGTCNVTLSRVASWSLSGDVATTVVTDNYFYSGPPGCFPPDRCLRTTGTRTRIAPAPSSCGYTILASAGPNGSISPSGAVLVPSLGSQTFTITPDAGFVIASVLVDGADVGPVASYTFTDVTSDHTIAATFGVTIGFAFKPGKLHLGLHEAYVTGYFTPPVPYNLGQFDVSSIRLNGSVAQAPGTDATIVSTALKVKFLRSELAPTLTIGDDVTITATGTLAGVPFVGTDVIDVSAPRVHLASSTLVAGTTTEVGWDVPGASPPTVTLLSTFDGGTSWNVEAEGVPNTGQFTWTVPDVATADARLAIVQVYATDETGLITESEFAVSDPFSISSPLVVVDHPPAFALRVSNPAREGLSVQFSIAGREKATLAAYDVSGRQAAWREVEAGSGWQTASLGRLPAGVYVVRLTQGARSVSRSVAVVK